MDAVCTPSTAAVETPELAWVSLPSIDKSCRILLRPEAITDPHGEPRQSLALFRHVMDMLEAYAFQKAQMPLRILFEAGLRGEVIAAMPVRLAELLVREFPHYVGCIEEIPDPAAAIAAATALRRRCTATPSFA